jgi:hypothetical protein
MGITRPAGLAGKATAVASAVLLLGTTAAMAAGSDDAWGATKFRILPFTDKTRAATATGDAHDPDVCGSGPSTNSVWYRFQPRRSGKVTMNTFGSRYDTVLAVFKSSPGQAARHLRLIVCNDDVFSPFFSLQSRVKFHAKRNVTYFVMIDPWADTEARKLVFHAF